ncbi:MAG: hypothetical protein A3D95_06135 [Betaproteobacteria bacterium RIFCSPHIGHO2_12_FULL_69_13]|nr:MAG: hypothetical protein A3D95_06135 [Betaproteobacteria bacterium RIFCSPHIGHO2_12_FULL_69_13]OGA67341.1 MAG: hypothetical protein A3G83_15950 [Betaproteobacteria bacterium RIFCSPLOWO2_12_FULL_68_20]
MRFMKQWLLALGVVAPLALAQGTLEIIPLRHRTVDQVLPVLRPLLEPGGTLTGQSSQLIVRTNPRNLAEIKQALDAIDRPLRRLQISVRFDTTAGAERQDLEARGTVRSGDVTISNRRFPAERSEASVRVQEERSSLDERVDQRVQVLEGGRAFISTGQSRPVRQREVIRTPGRVVVQETTAMQDLATGFEVVPRLSGDMVFLDIAPQRETPGALPGSVQSQRVASSVSARLGEWFEIGGSSSAESRDERGILSTRRSGAAESRRVWVKVEEVRD